MTCSDSFKMPPRQRTSNFSSCRDSGLVEKIKKIHLFENFTKTLKNHLRVELKAKRLSITAESLTLYTKVSVAGSELRRTGRPRRGRGPLFQK